MKPAIKPVIKPVVHGGGGPKPSAAQAEEVWEWSRVEHLLDQVMLDNLTGSVRALLTKGHLKPHGERAVAALAAKASGWYDQPEAASVSEELFALGEELGPDLGPKIGHLAGVLAPVPF